MESKAKLFGHAIHPMLIVFPLGLLVMAVIFDVIWLGTHDAIFNTIAYYDIAAGIIGGLIAAVPGLIDWLAVPSGTRAKAIGLWHACGNVVVLALFAASWWLRRDVVDHVPSSTALALGFVGLALGAVTGWLGGELVERLGVGVDRGAHLNSSNSLSGLPAEQGQTAVHRRDRAPA
jgi:uncharacterized membrane protein